MKVYFTALSIILSTFQSLYPQAPFLKTRSESGLTLGGWPGAKVSYSYYIDSNKNEIDHGKATSSITNPDRHKSDWTGTENITYHLSHGVIHGRISVTYNKTYWYSNYKFVGGVKQTIYKVMAMFFLPQTSFNIYNSYLDGKINFNNGVYEIVGEAKEGYWIGNLVIKQRDEISGKFVKVFDQLCQALEEGMETFEYHYPTLGGFAPTFLNIEGIYPYKIQMPLIYYRETK